MDIVGQFIELKAKAKEIEEQLGALEVIIFEDHRDDERITIRKGKVTRTIKKETYQMLESLGVETTVTIEKEKTLDDFDVNIREFILGDESNFDIKVSKESIIVKKD